MAIWGGVVHGACESRPTTVETTSPAQLREPTARAKGGDLPGPRMKVARVRHPRRSRPAYCPRNWAVPQNDARGRTPRPIRDHQSRDRTDRGPLCWLPPICGPMGKSGRGCL